MAFARGRLGHPCWKLVLLRAIALGVAVPIISAVTLKLAYKAQELVAGELLWPLVVVVGLGLLYKVSDVLAGPVAAAGVMFYPAGLLGVVEGDPGVLLLSLAGSITVISLIALRGLHGHEPLLDFPRLGYRFYLTPVLVALSLSLWYSRLVLKTTDALAVIGLAFLAATSSLYISPLARTLPLALALGMLAGLPLTSPIAAAIGSGAPLMVGSPLGGVRVGELVALAGVLSRSRSLDSDLGLTCAGGSAVLYPEPNRVLILGGRHRIVPSPERLVTVRLVPGETNLTGVERALSEGEKGGKVLVDVGVSEKHTMMAALGVVARYARETGSPVYIDACNIWNLSIAHQALEPFEGVTLLWLRVCTVPDERLSSLFSGRGSARLACPPLDRELVGWALRHILGRGEKARSVERLERLLSTGYCLAAPLYPGAPGLARLPRESGS